MEPHGTDIGTLFPILVLLGAAVVTAPLNPDAEEVITRESEYSG